MITVTDGPIIAATGKEAVTYDAATVTFRCEVESVAGQVTATIVFKDADGKTLVEVPYIEYPQSEFAIASESITNPNIIFLRELEKSLVDYLETVNPTATFTIS